MWKLIVVLLCSASIAGADPETRFVELGGSVGGTHEGDMSAGLTAGGGYRLTHLVWLHAMGAAGTAPAVHIGWAPDHADDRFAELRGGVELKTCTATGIWCGLFGVDVGYRHDTYARIDRSGGEAVARFGLDIGAKYVRVRPVLEGTSTHTGDTMALVLGVAYAW
jgi:hypothetical protein